MLSDVRHIKPTELHRRSEGTYPTDYEWNVDYFFTSTTWTDKYKGLFVVSYTPSTAGVVSCRITYDGYSQYAPTECNVVKLIVTV